MYHKNESIKGEENLLFDCFYSEVSKFNTYYVKRVCMSEPAKRVIYNGGIAYYELHQMFPFLQK